MICPRCGAENQPSAKICRMCATPLESVSPMANASKNPYSPNMSPLGNPLGNPKPIVSPPAGNSAGQGELLCPTCKAVNDATWAYCQQCGSQLHKMGMPKPVQSVPAAPPIAPMSPVAPMPPMPQVTPQIPPMSPMNKPQPMAGTAIATQKPIVSPALEAVRPTSNAVINCSSCGRINTPGSSFCATCGSALPGLEPSAISSSPRGFTPKLRLIQEGGGDGEIYKLDTEETIIGRNNGDIRFPHDGYMSGRHARIIRRGEHFVLVDENSRNGTFKRIDGEVELKAGDIILIGKQLFRFEL
ncbi:MAG: zinc ribbon domain-containing protein [Acidobacteria bacterium]|nr:zinc ribbon domain-containing protein [Acidobacteriota bacterium]